VQFAVQFWSSAVTSKVFSLRLISGVERRCLSSVGSLIQGRGAATEKALSPNNDSLCETGTRTQCSVGKSPAS